VHLERAHEVPHEHRGDGEEDREEDTDPYLQHQERAHQNCVGMKRQR
jgi:hypothetical protein